MELITIYLAAGLAAGLVSGLFGLGGGLTIVPALAFALPLEGVDEKYVMHLSVGTSLVVMVVTALYTTVLRHRSGDLDWALFRRIAPRVVVGAVLGAICGDLLPGMALRVFFIGFVSYTIARALQRRYGAAVKPASSDSTPPTPALPRQASLWTYGLATGLCGALLGAGAAIIIVPYLRAARYRIQVASAAAAGLSAVIGI
ncbi:MAG: sulfite exporter TauE/SafE family protein, partial [Deltaproteobacteria bacterium]|nr:sulfite exporter TauE/SafE family protein [Deltaproteobacteria bacterium]